MAARYLFRRFASAAVFDHRSRSFLAHLLCLGSVCAVVLRAVIEAKSEPPKSVAARSLGRLSHGFLVVCRQLLLDLPDHALLRWPAPGHFGRHSHRLQHGAGALLRRSSVCCSRPPQRPSAAPITRCWPRPFSGSRSSCSRPASPRFRGICWDTRRSIIFCSPAWLRSPGFTG